MTSKLCSVIVPIYNAAPYLAQCLSSIKMQTYKDLQVILVDDGSTDESGEIAKSFVEADKRFVLIQQSNQGQSAARNVGIKKAEGEYLVFVDADDYIDSDFIEQHVAVLGDADYVQSGYRRVTVNGEIIVKKLPVHRYQFTSPCMRLYQMSWIQQHAFLFPQNMIYEDVVFSLLLWSSHPNVAMLRYIGYHYTYHTLSTTTTVNRPAQLSLYRTIHQIRCDWWIKQYTLLRLHLHFFLSTISHE